MERIKKVFRQIHIAFWVMLSLLAAFQFRGEGNTHWFNLTFDFIATGLYVFYSHFMLLTRYPGKQRRGAYFLGLFGILLTAPLLYVFIHHRRLNTLDLFSEYYFIALCSIGVPLVVLSWFARVTENLVTNTVRKEQLEKQAVESELYYLKSQLAPHFLFNTLNNIHTLVYKQAPTAPEAVMQLASLMRYMIYDSNAATVPLTRELAYLQDYIGLQQLRYKENPVVGLYIEGATDACHIAPLLFIHLIENAFKHCPARLSAGDLNVNISVQKDELMFRVQNPIGQRTANRLDEPGGIGLPNVRKRLALLYPNQHTLNIQDTGEVFIVVLHIHGLQIQPHERKAHLLYH